MKSNSRVTKRTRDWAPTLEMRSWEHQGFQTSSRPTGQGWRGETTTGLFPPGARVPPGRWGSEATDNKKSHT